MTEVQFNEEKWNTSSSNNTGKPTGISGLVIKLSGGAIKTTGQAQAALLILAVLFILLSIFLIPRTPKASPLPPEATDSLNKYGGQSSVK